MVNGSEGKPSGNIPGHGGVKGNLASDEAVI